MALFQPFPRFTSTISSLNTSRELEAVYYDWPLAQTAVRHCHTLLWGEYIRDRAFQLKATDSTPLPCKQKRHMDIYCTSASREPEVRNHTFRSESKTDNHARPHSRRRTDRMTVVANALVHYSVVPRDTHTWKTPISAVKPVDTERPSARANCQGRSHLSDEQTVNGCFSRF